VTGLTLALVALVAGARLPADTGHGPGPYDIALFGTSKVRGVVAHARLVYAPSPFGIAVTADGRARYDVQITATGLPAPSTLGPYTTYVVWAATPDLTQWRRLGSMSNGETTVGHVDFNKFLIVITAEKTATPSARAGPTVLHGTSPSGWLQTFLTHPMFRGVY
jgi:hypothetical protein